MLGLVQLWADTFMMQEDAYPAFMRAYRELRKEGLKFPPRDPNERFMIKFEGEPSPAFELADMEQSTGKVEARDARDSRDSRKRENRTDARGAPEEEPRLLESDVKSLREGLEVLEELLCSARDVRELQEPRAKDYIRKCRGGQKKLMWVVSYKTEMADEASVIQLISIMEYVNNKMENFKKAAGVLKRGGSSAEIRELLKGTEKKSGPVDLLDLGEDFLEIADANPLDGLEKFVHGREVRNEIPREVVQREIARVEEEKRTAARVEEEKKAAVRVEEVKKSPMRLEQPDLLFDEIEPVPQGHNLMDLNSLQIGPPVVQTAYPGYAPYNPNPGASMYNPSPQVLKAQPSGDDFEDFFSDLANRRAY